MAEPATPFVWGAGGAQMTPERIAAERKVAQALMMQGMDYSPVQHWTQGVSRVAQALLGGYDSLQLDKAERANAAADREMLAKLLPSAQPAAVTPAVTPAVPSVPSPAKGQPVVIGQGGMAKPEADGTYGSDAVLLPNATAYGPAIASIESAGEKDPYRAIGPATRTGARAYGKHQVMDFNIGPWTQEVLGRTLTPQQFLDDPAVQEAVFDRKMGQYTQQYGNPADAASMWFTGKPAAQGANARATRPDGTPYGPTGKSYVEMFTKNMGQPAGGAMALVPPAAAPAVPAAAPETVPTATPAPTVSSRAILAAQALNSRYTSEGVKKVAQAILTQEMGRDRWVDERGSDGSFYQRNLLTGERKVIEKSDVLPDAAVKQKIEIAKGGKPETVINNTVNPILKGVGDRFNEGMEVAKASVPQIQGIHEARKALDQGSLTGIAAEPKLFGAKVANLFGLGGDAASNTEVLRSSIGNSVLAKAKTLGANPSNADRDYIEKVVGGSIALEEKSIRRLLDMQEKWARDAIRRANAEGKRLLDAQPKELAGVAPLLSVDEPEDYATFLKNNPIAAPAAAPAPAVIDGYKIQRVQ